MKRKVVKHGPSSLIVSLPSEWVKRYNIVQGDEIDAIIKEQTLILSTGNRTAKAPVEVNISNMDRTLIYFVLRGLCRSGCEEIKITYGDEEVLYERENTLIPVKDVIDTETALLLGYEIIDEKEHEIVIKNLQRTSSKEFKTIFRRLFILIKQTIEEMQSIVKTKQGFDKIINEQHDTILKLVSLLMMLLNNDSPKDISNVAPMYHFVGILDRMSDILKKSARDLKTCQLKTPIAEKNIDILQEIFSIFYTAYFKKDIKALSLINKKRNTMEQNCEKITSTKEAFFCMRIQQIPELLLHAAEIFIASHYVYDLDQKEE